MKMVDIDVDLDLTFLSIEERQTILNVLKRDEELRNAEDARKKELKNEINQLRQQSAIKVGEVQKSRQCQRCHEELGLIFSRGELCPKCKHLICGNCRTEVTNSTTYQWLCSLCYKQRQLPAVAGDWFYQQLDEKYKHELSSTYGSAVVRSSMRRLQPSDESETLSADNDKLSQSVDRPNPFTGAENGKSTDVPLYQAHGGIEGSVSQMVNEKPSLHNLTVRKVMSRADSSSSDNDSSDDEGKPAKHPNGDVSNGSHSNHENESSSPHKAPLDFNRRTSSSQSEPGELRIGVSQSHTVLRTTQSLNPAELLSPELRARSKSANGSIADEAAADDGTVESLTNIKFRRCSGVGVEEMRRLDSDDSESEKQSPIDGNGSGARVNVQNSDNSACDLINKSLTVSVHALPRPPKPPRSLLQPDGPPDTDLLLISTNQLAEINAAKPESLSPNTRRKISLTPELIRKSPMIGRREIDISEKFLRSFSDSSSSEEESDETDEERDLKKNVEESLSGTAIDMPPISRKNLEARLSVIQEDLSEDLSTLQRRKNPKAEISKLRLVLRPDNDDDKELMDSKTDTGTPVTPDKYNDNWQQFGSQVKAGNLDSWSSEPLSAQAEDPTANTDVENEGISDDMDANASYYAETSIISPRPVSKKIDSRRSALKKKSNGSSQATFRSTDSPSTNLFFQFPNTQSPLSSTELTDSSPQSADNLSESVDLGEGLECDPILIDSSAPVLLGDGKNPQLPINAETPVANPPGDSGSPAVFVDLDTPDHSNNNQVTIDENAKAATKAESDRVENEASMRNSSEDNPDRHSPDGCSPHSSRKGSNSESVGNLAVAADVSDTGASSSAPLIPALSVTDELEITVPLNVTQGKDLADDEDQTCHSDGEVDEFDEEDIDDLFEQAKREKTGGKSKLSSHLTISMESISSMFSDAGTDYHKHPVSGEMQFGLRYDKLTGVLTVTVYQCKELTAVHKKKKTSDPYVKVYLLDAEGQRLKKRKTSVKKSTINPQYGETFRYTLKEADLLSLTMQLSVWNFSRLGHSEFLGEINIPFDTYHFDTARERQWYPLSEKPHMKRHGSELSIISPELKIAIKYTPPIAADTALAKVSKASKQTGGDLHVKVISAQYLPTKKSGVYDPYVKCLLMPERMKHKTGVIKNNLNPVWDEGFTYHKIQAEELCELSLEFAVWDHDRFSSNELLGLVRLNTGKGESFGKACDWMDAVEQECSMWEEMINNPSEWVEHTLPLRDGTVASTSHKTPIQKTLSS